VSIKNFIQVSELKEKKVAGYSHRTAQPPILAAFLPWGGSAGAGRTRPAAAKVRIECLPSQKIFLWA